MPARVLVAVSLIVCSACTLLGRPGAGPVGLIRGNATQHGRLPTAADTGWRISGHHGAGIEGYADATDVAAGTPVTLYVSTAARRFRLDVIRMGWYAGHRGLIVRRLPAVAGHRQPGPVLQPQTNTVTAPWQPSLRMSTGGLPPGMYLLRLDASDGSQSYVPLTIRSPSVRGDVVLMSPVTTWQAYNRWGCCDLYAGADGSLATRARAVSFDRPYLTGSGAAEFITRELPVVAEAERLRLHLGYITDLDLDRYPHLLDGARALISMGHDEYWSPAMRAAVTAARDSGTNLVFLGANAMYRRIRLAATAPGADRLEIDYKVAAEDPLFGHDDPAVTSDWPRPPDPKPESQVTGETYGCFARVRAPAVVTDAASPLLAGAHLRNGEELAGLIGPETDRLFPGEPRPGPVDVLMHSPFQCPQGFASYADTTYYTAASGAGVFDSGTMSWVCAIFGACADGATAAAVRRITDNMLLLFARGPAGRFAVAHDNAAAVIERR